jgi:hypothetical protein
LEDRHLALLLLLRVRHLLLLRRPPVHLGGVFLISEMGPLGGSRGFRRPQILGCYVAKFALHEALKLIV